MRCASLNRRIAREEREDGDVAELELDACVVVGRLYVARVLRVAFTINIGKADEGESNVTATFKRATSTANSVHRI